MSQQKSSCRIPSAQLRLTRKAGSNKSAFNTPVPIKFYNQMSPPYTPHSRGDSIVQESSLWQKGNLIYRDATNFSTDSSVENLRISMQSGKLFNQSLDANGVNGINYKHSDHVLPERSLVVNKDIEEDKIKVSNETIKVTANLADGKRKVKIRNVPRWNGQQVYDPFASYHDQINKDFLTEQALRKDKKSCPYFGLPTRMNRLDSDASTRNIGEDTNKKELVTPVAKEFFQNQLSPPLTPINKRDSFDLPSRELKERGPAAMRRPNSNTCICLRSLKMILCTNCEYTFPGRIQKTCNPHPNDKYQLDVVICPKCKVDRNSLKECDIPQVIGNISNKLIPK